jgi:hypothetical protein
MHPSTSRAQGPARIGRRWPTVDLVHGAVVGRGALPEPKANLIAYVHSD